tara:strand:+ start:108 stop:437 length:330 start_codon:yes stop_codon:yes gene_type:complete
MRDDTKIIGFGDSAVRYGLHNGLTVSVVWHEFSYRKKDAEGNVSCVEMACFDTQSDDEIKTVWRTDEVWDDTMWDGAGGDDVLAHVPMGRVLELITEAEKWECPRCKKS